MRITRLHLHGIRRHRDLDIVPAPGLTVIRGPNEAGKSSVQTALEMALFRRATSTGRETQDVRTWGSTDDPSVELQFEHDGATGRLAKHFAGQRGTVELELDGQLITDPGQVDTVMAEMTGLPSEKFLRSTASVRHQELDGLDRDEGALRDRLQQSISGADRGTNSARRLLGDAVRRYRSEGTRNPGFVRQSRAELDRLQLELAEGEAALVRLEADRNALAVAHDRRAQLDAQLTRDQDALDAGERAVRLETSATDAEARYMRLRKAVELQTRITQGERDHPSSTPLPQLKEGVRRLKDLQFQIQELESGLELQPDLSAAEVEIVQPPRWRPVGLLAAVILVGALAVAGISLVTSMLPTILGLAIAVVLGVVGVGVAVWALRRYRRSQDVRHSAELQAAEIQRRLQGRAREEEQLTAANREKAMLLTSLGVPDVYAADALLDREAAHTSVIDELRAEQRGVLAGVAVSGDLAAERDRAAAEMDQSRHALAGLGGAAQDPASARVRALETLRQTQQARESAIQEEGQAQGRVDQNSIDAERVAALAESVDATGERLARQERRARVYELTLAAIDRAEQVTMKRAARYLEERMGEDLARITDDRYRRIEVNEQDLAFRVWSTEAGAWVSVQQLSRGTLDQVYLAARLGLVRQVTQDQRPPLIFDDPFVTFDDDRARRAAELLRDLARDHQVLYLTTSDRYDTVADSVVVLPGPTQRDMVIEPPAPVGIAQEPLSADPGPGPDDATVPLAASAADAAHHPLSAWPDATTQDLQAPWWQAPAEAPATEGGATA
jgi:DNA repair exonuclease SbcCD ATPase subunit